MNLLSYEFSEIVRLLKDSLTTTGFDAEASRVAHAWLTAIPGSTEDTLKPYFQLHYDKLVELIANHNIQMLWPLFIELTTHYRHYIDPKSLLPEAGVTIEQQRGREVLTTLRGLSAAQCIAEELLSVLERVFTFQQLAPSQCTLGRVQYLEQLGETLIHWMRVQTIEDARNVDGVVDLTDDCMALLVQHNLNAAEFLEYYLTRVDAYVADRLAQVLTPENLSFAYQQQLMLSLPQRTDVAYDPGLDPISHQVAAAIGARIRFVEYLHADDAHRREQGERGQRLFVPLSAAQLALSVGSMIQAELFPAHTPGEVLRRASESFSTPSAAAPSYTTFRNNAYKKSSNDVKTVNEKLDAVRTAVNNIK